jgi:hypothetical protein
MCFPARFRRCWHRRCWWRQWTRQESAAQGISQNTWSVLLLLLLLLLRSLEQVRGSPDSQLRSCVACLIIPCVYDPRAFE